MLISHSSINIYSSPLYILIFFQLYEFLWILDISPSSDICFAYIFSHSVICLFTLLLVAFEAQKLLIFIKFNLPIFFLLLAVLLLPYPKNHCKIQCHADFLLFFFSKSFIVLALTLIHLELILYVMRKVCNFTFLNVCIRFPRIICWVVISSLNGLTSLSRANIHRPYTQRFSFVVLYSVPLSIHLFMCQYHIALITLILQ